MSAGDGLIRERLVFSTFDHDWAVFYSAAAIALQYANVGDRDATLRWLERATEEPRRHLPEDLKCAREFEFVRSDSQFQSILHNLDLPVR